MPEPGGCLERSSSPDERSSSEMRHCTHPPHTHTQLLTPPRPNTAAAPKLNLAAAAATTALLLGSATAAAPAALAIGPVSVALDSIKLERVPCGAGAGTVGGVTFSGASSKAACLNVTAQATNPDKKTLLNADVFGRVGSSC